MTAQKTKSGAVAMTVTVSGDNETGETFAVYLRLRRGKSAEVREYARGAAFADYDRQGRLLGIEFLAPCQISVLKQIVRKEPPAVLAFLNRSVPAEFIQRKAS